MICIGKNENPQMCGIKIAATGKHVVDIFKSNYKCAKNKAGTFCESIDGEMTSCSDLDKAGCCLPTTYQFVKTLAGSQADAKLKEQYSACADTIKQAAVCPQVDL